jgi:hypothetical protein
MVINLREGKVKSAGPPSNDLAVGGNGGSGISRSPSHGSVRSSSSRRSGLHQAHVKHGSREEHDHREKGDSSGEGSEISWDVYKRYAKAMGGWKFWVPYAVVNVVAHVFMLGQVRFPASLSSFPMFLPFDPSLADSSFLTTHSGLVHRSLGQCSRRRLPRWQVLLLLRRNPSHLLRLPHRHVPRSHLGRHPSLEEAIRWVDEEGVCGAFQVVGP